jgi:hypothetical protein
VKIFLIAFLLSISNSYAHAEVSISSCDGKYVAAENLTGKLLLKKGTSTIDLSQIDHFISGGVFSLDNSLLVVYGPPKRVDPTYPQVTHLTLFDTRSRPIVVVKEIYGGGIYMPSFSVDQRFLAIPNQYGIDVLDMKSRKVESFDLLHPVEFPTQRCSLKDSSLPNFQFMTLD